MEKSSGIFSGKEPRSMSECVEDAILQHLERAYASNEEVADKSDNTEKTIRNWKSEGLPRNITKFIKFARKDPVLLQIITGRVQ